LEKADTRLFNLPIVPFLRVGLGFNDGDFKNIPIGNDLFISGNIDGLRFETAAGLDVRLIVAQRVMVGIGAGVSYWNAFDVSGAAHNGVGVVVISNDHSGFEGLDIFTRLTIGIIF
jgi:hypothetical protein